MIGDTVTVDTGGFLFWRNTRTFKKDQIKDMHINEGSYSTCVGPAAIIELESGEIVKGTIDNFNNLTSSS